MCGIIGLVAADHHPPNIQEMMAAVGHRGPDDRGSCALPGAVYLGHARLAIIDLSPAGHQPMSYAEGRYWITFNGEIYNFAALRTELETCGHRFRSDGDTEVLLAAYAQWGPECLHRLRGMFAFAIWDEQEQTLFLARDRFGIKPLLYAWAGKTFLFASELKALLASGLISRQVDRQAIWHYLSLGAIPQPHTILAQVKALLPGHYMLLHNGHMTVRRYWDISELTYSARLERAGLAYQDAVAEVRRLLEEATNYHLIADVPVGAFLSGGVDSTALVGLMSQQVNHPLKTHSIGFESQHQRLSELAWARLAAERFGADHTEVIVTGEDVAREFDRITEALDQPSIDGINTYFVSQATRRRVTVALSGLGGDELFAGYPQFMHFARHIAMAPNGMPQLRPLALMAGKALPGRWRLPLESLTANPLQRMTAVRRLLNEDAHQMVVQSSFFDGFRPQNLEGFYRPLLCSELDAVQQMSYVEVSGYLRDTLLRDVDVMSMAHALEVRPVLLDHVLAEFIFSLPATYKLNGRTGKRIFLDAVADLLPDALARRPKMGFELPLIDWLQTSLRSRALDAFSSTVAKTLFTDRFLRTCRHAVLGRARCSLEHWACFILVEHFLRYGYQLDGA